MAAVSEYSMSTADREFLRKKTEYLTKNLLVDDVFPFMTEIFDQNSEDLIRAEPTPRKKIIKFLDLLSRRGAKAFNAFLVATYQVQEYIARELAEERGVKLVDILLKEQSKTAAGKSDMKDVHRQILRQYLPEFPKLDVEKMLASLKEANIVKLESQCQAILEKQTNRERVTKLFELLPKLGPKAFDVFFNALKINQPQLYHDVKQKIKRSHPDIFQGDGKCYPESSSVVAMEVSQNCNLSTPCSELPVDVLGLVEEYLNKPNEVLENDWKRFYKVLKLPEGKENGIAENQNNPTRFVMNIWIDRDGRLATVKKLLEALMECGQGGLVHKIERMLCVELKHNYDIADGVENMHVDEEKKNEAIRIVKYIPQVLKAPFISRLNGLQQGVLSDVASAVKEERCDVLNAEDFLEKLGEQKMRILFRELRKAKQCEITKWMRNKFPAGSTGPVKSDDELRPAEMNYGRRKEVTDALTAKGYWRELASHDDINMSATQVALLERLSASKDPSDCVLSNWEAQGLHTVITTAAKLQYSDHELYILKDATANEGRGAAVGMIKVGRKTLFLLDMHGVQNEVVPLCVMDFYVHHTQQRHGCGKKLFEHMLKIHNLQPSQVAIDRPSHKFLSFLKKHYGLQNSILQSNKFLVFDQFFRDMNAVGYVPRRSQRLRSGNQVNNRPPVHPYRKNSGSNEEQQLSSSQQPPRRLSTRRSSRKDQPMDVDDVDSNSPVLPVVPAQPFRERSAESMRSVGSAGSRESSAHGARGLAAQASLYSRHSSADIATPRHNSTASQLWKRNAISAGMRSLHACSEDNPFAIGQSFINNRSPTKEANLLEFGNRRPNTIQLKPLGSTSQGKSNSLSSTGSYTLSSMPMLSSHTKQNSTNHGTSWNVFGIPPVDTSPKTSYQAKLGQGRTFPF
ncbi:alpha-tubulin N-acetyltransferase 1-like [Paramuricea clavata]|uniref:Alpha-tubulin N-acetyltransferase n=1 Tax=Paramuricea clavata TaxID=317549 RepID=A0A6S7HEM5_PARCT|nr:alpha-tubulin N-acetyltransferase 1-like [Paramuricea clavata]